METVEVHYLSFGQFKSKAETEKVTFKVTNESEVEFGGTEFYKIEVAAENAPVVTQILSTLSN